MGPKRKTIVFQPSIFRDDLLVPGTLTNQHYIVQSHCHRNPWIFPEKSTRTHPGSTISTLLHDRINPKDCQVLSLGDTGFLGCFKGLWQTPTSRALEEWLAASSCHTICCLSSVESSGKTGPLRGSAYVRHWYLM